MTPLGLPVDAERLRALLDDLVSGAAAHQPLSNGIDLRTLKAGAQLGLALQIAPQALQAGQLQRVMERRFEQAVSYAGCFVFLNDKGALVIWHKAVPADVPLATILSRLLSLAELGDLDRHCN